MILPSSHGGNGFRRHSQRGRRTGVALVIVLAFVVLLTGLIVAYFARSITGRQLSNSSAGQTKAALLAQSASDFVISGLKQEIVSGSTATLVGPSGYQSNVYVPTSPLTAVPVRFGTPPPFAPAPSASPIEAIPNLVRRSVAGDTSGGSTPIPSPAVPSYASKVNSTNDKAINLHAISAARWNSHYLVPRITAANDADTTPDANVNFPPPDWVLMTRSGPAVETGIGTGSTAINNPIASNQNYVVGRYAYAVYDEGGLLDMNVAGYPSTATAAQIGRKGSLALADLTQLPISISTTLPQKVVDQIVGWRNTAAAMNPNPSSGGSSSPFPNAFPNFTWSTAQAVNWYNNFANGNMNGFRQVYGGVPGNASYSGLTDQAFMSRQQLLHLCNSINQGTNPGPFSPNALQYMGTFSRTLEQPSFVPAHIQYPANTSGTGYPEAPNINAVSATIPPPAATADSYLGNNDQAGNLMSGMGSVQDYVNPAFLSVRVTSAFTRNDGSTAVIGEPLVKRRFSLRRLSWITYKGPSASNMGDYNVQQSILAMGGDPTNAADPVTALVGLGNAANIQKYFGLTWTQDPVSNAWVWVYGHPNTSIMTLSQVAQANREPDFAELLKASINVGSLAKGAPNLNYHSNQVLNYQYTVDTTVDYNIFQIMANLVDQFDADSYPTVIEVPVSNNTGTYMRAFRGVEDLPYFYRYHQLAVLTKAPSLPLTASNAVTFKGPGGTYTTTYTTPATGVPALTPTGQGQVVMLWVPDVWNPHDMNSMKGTTGTRPSRFRLSVVTDDPVGLSQPWNEGAYPHVAGQVMNYSVNPPVSIFPPDSVMPPVNYTILSDSSTSFTFGDNSGLNFREPTLLWRNNVPTGSNLTPDAGSLAGPYTDVNTNVAYYGAFVGQGPAAFNASIDPTVYTATPADANGKYIFETGGQVEPFQKTPAGTFRQYTFRLSYQDPTSQNWIVYDEKYPDLHGLTSPQIILNKTEKQWSTTSQYANAYRNGQFRDDACDYDPRVTRYGIGTVGHLDDSQLPFLEPASITAYNAGDTSAGNVKFGLSNFTVINTIRPLADRGNQTQYSGPCQTSDPGNMPGMRWFSGLGWNAAGGYSGVGSTPDFYSGLLSQNNFNFVAPARTSGAPSAIYYEDADGVGRRAMGAYANPGNTGQLPPATPATVFTLPDFKSTAAQVGLEGLPEATANSIANGGVATALQQSQSRPLILNRPFRSVAEMSYASRGGVWKQIDFFTPESGDTGLLDTFCIDDPLPDAMVAGKVNLNTHQKPVLKAILANAYRDETGNNASAPGYVLPPLTAAEADAAAQKITSITSDATNAWHGPFTNIGEIVGRYVPTPGSGAGQSDVYTYGENYSPTTLPAPNTRYTYSGLSAALDSTVYSASSAVAYKVQRMRETAIRPLADAGQTRVWNLMIDVVAQTGRYPSGVSALSQFNIEGEKRYWVHVAIDRLTGEVIDRQLEEVTE